MRKQGYYWVNYENDWHIGFYNPGIELWFIPMLDNGWIENRELSEIDEKQIVRAVHEDANNEETEFMRAVSAALDVYKDSIEDHVRGRYEGAD